MSVKKQDTTVAMPMQTNSGVMKMGEFPEPAIIGGGLNQGIDPLAHNSTYVGQEENTHESNNQMMNPGMTGGQQSMMGGAQ